MESTRDPQPGRLHSLIIAAALLLAAAGPLAAQPSPPRSSAPQAAPEAIDAWGRTVNAAEMVESLLALNFSRQMGSPAWGPLAMKIVALEGNILPRLYWAAAAELQCGKRFRRERPSSSADDYRKSRTTPEGAAWLNLCLRELLDDPQTDSRIKDGMVASLETALAVGDLLLEVREQRIEEGLPDVPELTPEMERELPERARQGFAGAACLIGKALEKASLGRLVSEPALLKAPVMAALQAGVCEPKASS